MFRKVGLTVIAIIRTSLDPWLKSPNRLDIVGVDTPDPNQVFSSRSPRAQAVDLAKEAKKAPLEVWIGNVNRYDLQGVDTTPKDKKVKRYKVVDS